MNVERYIESKERYEALYSDFKYENLYLVYQPKVKNITGELVGLEALIRIKGKEKISIEKYIRNLEEEKLIHVIDYFVFEKVIGVIKERRNKGRPRIGISINMCTCTLLRDDFEEFISNGVKEIDLNKELEIEITERNIPFDKIKDINKRIRFLKENNIRVAIDDFGIGNSNISLLIEADIDTLKLDKSLIRNIIHSNKSKNILKYIFNMCKAINVDVIVEGVERKEELEALVEIGGEFSQGYYFSKPLLLERISNKYYI
nr:EAL domain-containing protein [Clostridium chrysemydis]